MGNADLTKQRANVYKFLSTLYRDEISEDLVAKLTGKEFVAKLKNFSKECNFSDLGKGLDMMAKYLARGKLNQHKDLSYEYADIFLNAGENPALPYESVHSTGEPVVMQKSVFDVRAAFRKAGVHKSDDYKDFDDYIAVELEFVRYLLEKGDADAAAAATDWIQPIPGTDGAIATAMCYVIVKNELYDKDFVENWTHGFEDFKKRLLGEEDGVARTPEWAEKISGVPAETIDRIAREFAAAKAKGVGSWAGTSQCPNGYETTMAVQALNGLCGTFDAPGGPSLPFKRKLKPAWGEGQTKPPANSPPKLDKANMWAGAIPSYFPKNVAEGKIKAMINWFGDPILSWGNEIATAKACRDLEFLVTIDAWMPNVGPLSDVVLPDVVAAEDSQVKADWLYEAFIAYYAQLVKPVYNVRPWWWMCKHIANRLGLGEHFPWEDINEANENMLTGTPWSFEELKEKGFIITDEAEYYKYKKWGSLNVPEGYGSSGKTKTGKYNFKNPVAEEKGAEALPDYIEPPAELKPDDDYPLIFGNFRLLEHEHSSTFNNYALMKLRPTNPLWVNVKDAEARGIEKGDKVIVRSPWGHKTLVATPTEDIREGTVGSAGGYGHIRGLEADPKYRQFGGTNTPGLIKPNTPDPNAGNPMIKYIKVQVEAA